MSKKAGRQPVTMSSTWVCLKRSDPDGCSIWKWRPLEIWYKQMSLHNERWCRSLTLSLRIFIRVVSRRPMLNTWSFIRTTKLVHTLVRSSWGPIEYKWKSGKISRLFLAKCVAVLATCTKNCVLQLVSTQNSKNSAWASISWKSDFSRYENIILYDNMISSINVCKKKQVKQNPYPKTLNSIMSAALGANNGKCSSGQMSRKKWSFLA